jgi:S-(hydroxymethyl)glutathione dehydrogenase/alcohol dehydrogenase
MRAAVLDGEGTSLRVEELELEPPRAGEVLVRIAASGVCHSDLHQADGDWGETGPMVLGHEGAGVVEAVGDGVEVPRVGQLVALNWYYPCLSCEACQQGRQWMCSGTGALEHRMPDGTNRLRRADGTKVAAYLALGTFAERVVVPVQAAVPLPDETPPEVAALIGCSVTTGVMAVLRTAEVRPASTVAVIGLGGVGLSVVMGAVLAGATTIVAVDRVPEKLDRARDLGATHTVLAADADAAREAIHEATGGGPEFAFEAVGLTSTIEMVVSVLPPGGTAVLVGLTRLGERASFDAFDLVDGSRRIVGSNYGWSIPAVDFPRLVGLYLAGRLPVDRLIDERIGLDSVNDALDAMRRGEGVRRVIVF